ncbi:MAG: hypothetical protein DCC73_02255 [Proteobacteria bacterium]|nr:MAG: hypothetical protein DCC73_02255 [Pseudomonadota bacterium]
MLKRVIAGATAAVFASVTVSPAFAFERFEGLAADKEVTAGVRLTLPFGPRTAAEKPAWIGLGLTATRNFDGAVGYRDNTYYKVNLAEVRLSQDQLTTFRFGNLTALTLDAEGKAIDQEKSLNFLGNSGNGNGWLWLGLAVAAGVGLYLILDDDDDSESEGLVE